MDVRARFTAPEWADLCSAPFVAAIYVATAEGGQVAYTQELVAVTRALGPSLEGAGELARAVVGELGGRLGNRLGTGELAIARDDRAAMLALVRRAGEALERAGADEAAPYASWVVGLARRAAAASVSGGILGIGGRPISAAEEVALRELKTALRAGAP